MSVPARSALAVAQVDGRSAVVRSRSASPLKLLAPGNHGHGAWVYQSSYGGGLLGGDEVALELEVGEGATLFLSSQSSSKVYRGRGARFDLRARVGADATLLAWPDPVVCFAGAEVFQCQRFDLQRGSNLLVVDAWTAGRVARGERWAFERVLAQLTVDVGGARSFHDALELSNAHGPLRERLRGLDALATVLLAGPRLAPAIEAIRRAVDARPLNAPVLAVASPAPIGLVLRLAAPAVEALTHTLRELLHPHVAALLGDDPLARKW